ncbi:hypothetical protein CBR_g1013 [Chara braunii]|uniref:Uncharacterized protein n=1 Tax=Chara braunii TaxID=69332 RepID=A0A388KCU9_CHABU|nr:hypothetical protein CBR_g1013 [Chara braunii]|eukprot:GBG67894.1 hypothetical protein CBR_g1013 [Chara braunii]
MAGHVRGVGRGYVLVVLLIAAVFPIMFDVSVKLRWSPRRDSDSAEADVVPGLSYVVIGQQRQTDLVSSGDAETAGVKGEGCWNITLKVGDGHGDTEGEGVSERLVNRMVAFWAKEYTARGSATDIGDEEERQGGESMLTSAGGGGGGGGVEEAELGMLGRLLKTRPPHLANCSEEEEWHLATDKRNADGSVPDWALDNPPPSFFVGGGGGRGPFPPWIRGADDDNMPLTRVAQRDIWVHQHPVDCNSPEVKFLVADWWPLAHGTGSQIHGMTTLFARALESGRVLILSPTYARADQENCAGDTRGRLDCYFAPTTSAECHRRAMTLLEEQRGREDSLSDDNKPVVYLQGTQAYYSREVIPKRWGSPWKDMRASIFAGGSVHVEGGEREWAWWRTQAVRYLMRWPTAYLCRIINRARNQSFGKSVARAMVLSAASLRNDTLYAISVKALGGGWGGWERQEEKEENRKEIQEAGLAATLQEQGEASGGRWRGADLYMPRPMISVHVRIAKDKRREMSLFDLPAYMRFAEGIRGRDPDLRNVWLSTEGEAVVKLAEEYASYGWRIFYTRQHRIKETQADYDNEVRGNGANFELVEKSLANLVIASEADYFVGALASNWCRLIDELRKTNGRFSRRYVGINYDQW